MDWNFRKSWIWRIRGGKFLIFRSIYYSSKYRCPYFFVFSTFKSRDYRIGPRKNLPIGFGTMIFKFTAITVVLYIIWKHVIHWVQKFLCDRDRIVLERFMGILIRDRSKWQFLMKKRKYSHVTHHFEGHWL